MSPLSHELNQIRVDGPSTRLIGIIRGTEVHLPALWVRERAQHASQLDSVSQQRLFNPHELDPDIAYKHLRDDGETIYVAFTDGHEEHYHRATLIELLDDQGELPSPKPWRHNLEQRAVRYEELNTTEGMTAALSSFLERGFLLIRQTPTRTDSIFQIAEQFGYVRTTNFGRLFEVYSRPNSSDLAYRHHALSPHTDNPYRDPVPGIQLLHCLVNDSVGGESTLVDGLAVCDTLGKDHPASLAILKEVPVRFRFVDSTTEVISEKPIIATGHHGEITGLHYSPRLDFMPLMPEAKLRKYHQARQQLGQLLKDPQYELRFKLETGDLLMFDNARVLHGRTEFDPATGHRHLQGCYIERDEIISRFRMLQDKEKTL